MTRATGYRALPWVIQRPSDAVLITKEKFDDAQKRHLQTVAGEVVGHRLTEVWYAAAPASMYLLRMSFDGQRDVFATSICTFTPSQGMDSIDGCFAEDVEAFVLEKVLGVHDTRLDILEPTGQVEVRLYLKERGIDRPGFTIVDPPRM